MRKRICAVLLLLLVFSLCFGSAALAEQADEGLDHITDAGNILTAEEVQRLEALAAQYDELGVKLYIVTMEDYREYPGDGIMDCAGELYEYFDLGTQPDNNGVLLLLSMKELPSSSGAPSATTASGTPTFPWRRRPFSTAAGDRPGPTASSSF